MLGELLIIYVDANKGMEFFNVLQTLNLILNSRSWMVMLMRQSLLNYQLMTQRFKFAHTQIVLKLMELLENVPNVMIEMFTSSLPQDISHSKDSSHRLIS